VAVIAASTSTFRSAFVLGAEQLAEEEAVRLRPLAHVDTGLDGAPVHDEHFSVGRTSDDRVSGVVDGDAGLSFGAPIRAGDEVDRDSAFQTRSSSAVISGRPAVLRSS